MIASCLAEEGLRGCRSQSGAEMDGCAWGEDPPSLLPSDLVAAGAI